MIEQEKLLEYIRAAKEGDERAKAIIFENNSPLIKSIIRRFKNKGVEYDDLFQIACIGFLKAINNFDESFGVKFSTYTVPMIIGEIKRYMRDNGAIKVPRTLKMLANKINKYIDEYQSKNNVSPTTEHLSKVFSITEEDVVIAMDSLRMPISIYNKFEEDEEKQELIEKIPHVDTEESTLTRIHLSNVISTLTERERKLVLLRYFRDRTQTEIAENLGVSQVQVSRLESKIIEKMRLKF